jgi:radical SAM protein with 4Fe4S-binding SPASM domain
MTNERFLAREEFFGLLLFDRQQHKYVVPTDGAALEATRIIVDEGRVPTAEELAHRAGVGEGAARRALAEAEKIGLRPGNATVEVRQPQPGRLSAPLNVYLDHTSFCNLTCGYCYDFVKLDGRKRKLEIGLSEVVAILDQLREMGIFRMDIAGGEPLLWKEFFLSYLGEARARDLSISVTSNGTLIDEELAERLIDHDLKTVTISVDGWNEETNDASRGAGSFVKACRGIGHLVAAKRRRNAPVHLAIKNTFAPGLDEEGAKSFVFLGIRLGVDKVKFNPMRPSGNAEKWTHLVNDPQLYYRTLGNIQKAIDAYGDQIEVSGPMNPATCFGGRIPYLSQWGCIAGKELIAIDSVGNVRPCSMMTEYILGNVRERRLRDIYENSERNIRLREARDESCDGCQAHGACGGGCRVRSMAAGDMFRKDPLCPVDAGVPVRIGTGTQWAFEYLGLPHSL